MSIVITSWLFLLLSAIIITIVGLIRISRSGISKTNETLALEAFAFYICIVVSVTLLPIRIPGEIPYDFEYNLNPLEMLSIFYNRGMLVSALENVLLFMPISLLGCFAHVKWVNSIKASILTAFLLSLIIELLQGLEGYFMIAEGSMPVMDITDIITNTIGGFAGYIICYFYRKQHTVESE